MASSQLRRSAGRKALVFESIEDVSWAHEASIFCLDLLRIDEGMRLQSTICAERVVRNRETAPRGRETNTLNVFRQVRPMALYLYDAPSELGCWTGKRL